MEPSKPTASNLTQNPSELTHFLFIDPADPSQSFIFEITSQMENTQTMEELMDHISKERNIVYKISDMFGNKINKTAHVLYYKNLQPFYIEHSNPRCTEYSEYTILMNTLAGQSIELNVNSFMTVSDVRRVFHEKQGTPIDEDRLLFKAQQLEDDTLLGDHGINAGKIVIRIPRLKGKGALEGGSVGIIDDKKTLNEPSWRTIKHGLSLEGVCKNEKCEAFDKWVIIPKGTGNYDVILEYDNNQCPACLELVEPKKCGFKNCTYTYVGTKQVSGEPIKKVVYGKEIVVGENYEFLDPEVAGKADWLSLKIVTKSDWDKMTNMASKRATALTKAKTNVAEACGICSEKVPKAGENLECGHQVHKKCLGKIKHLNIKCPICFI